MMTVVRPLVITSNASCSARRVRLWVQGFGVAVSSCGLQGLGVGIQGWGHHIQRILLSQEGQALDVRGLGFELKALELRG
jgi:hypothetical protein